MTHVVDSPIPPRDAAPRRSFLVRCLAIEWGPEGLRIKAARQLRAIGVDLRLGVTVTNIDEHGVETSTGTIRAGTVVWAAGNQASSLASMLGGPTDRAGRAIVADDLSILFSPMWS